MSGSVELKVGLGCEDRAGGSETEPKIFVNTSLRVLAGIIDSVEAVIGAGFGNNGVFIGTFSNNSPFIGGLAAGGWVWDVTTFRVEGLEFCIGFWKNMGTFHEHERDNEYLELHVASVRLKLNSTQFLAQKLEQEHN